MKIIIVVSIFLMSVMGISQSDGKKEQFIFKSFSFSPSIYLDGNTGGLVFSSDLSYAYNESIFSFSFINGGEVSILGSADYFMELNLFYGKEFKLSKKTLVEIHSGLGYFYFEPASYYQNSSYVIGLPITTKFRFIGKSKFSFGFQLHANINSVNTVYSLGVLLQWNKKQLLD